MERRAEMTDSIFNINPDNNLIDRYSSTWQSVNTWARAELAKARAKNDSLNTEPNKTIELRSRIKTLKELLLLPEPVEKGRIG